MAGDEDGRITLHTLRIDDLTKEGIGLGRLDGQVILVAGALPGDRVQVRLTHRARRHAVATLVALLDPSPDRRRPPCILADHCGGCTLQALDDPAQVRWKQRLVDQTLQRVGGVTTAARPLLTAPEPLGYRNRAVIPLERDGQGRLRAGYYRRGSHQIVNMNRCPVLDPRLDAMIAPLKADLEASGWPVDRHGAAGLRHLALRIGRRRGERLLTLVASHGNLPGLADWAASWMERWPDLVGVTLNLQPQPDNRLFGPRNHTICGRDWLLESFAGVDLRIGPDTFFQVCETQAERVVALLLDALGPPRGRLVEGYCGIGTFSLPLARAGWSVWGIESHAGAVELARANALGNGLADRSTFVVGDVAQELEVALAEPAAAVLVDPPRKGLDGEVVGTLVRHRPPLVAYLSCDPATLARDLARLRDAGGYDIRDVQPLDFFPNTSHVETLALLALP
ncbi:MAG: 23S rRNA (uracil(1939)-C(5))-methyltransferase RlmD [Cyanobacteriota bacterium]